MPEKRIAGHRLKRGLYKSVPGKNYETPKEVWGFRGSRTAGSPEQVARGFLEADSKIFQLEDRLAGLRIQRVVRGVGSTHVIFSQQHAGRRVHRGYVTVHMDRGGRVYLAKNRSVPARLLPEKFKSELGRAEAVRKARHSLPKKYRESRLAGAEPLWYPKEKKLLPAWKVRI